MPLYKKKAPTFEAVQWTGRNFHDVVDLVDWSRIDRNAAVEKTPRIERLPSNDLIFSTPSADVPVDIGDWIVKNEDGDCVPWNIADFAEAFEPCG